MAADKIIQSIYTDGACSGNPGPGGWGTVIYFSDGSVQELGGGDAQTTNNRMEMQAAIEALEYLLAFDLALNSAESQGSAGLTTVPLYTDSEYVKNGITKWLTGWKKKGWKTAAGKPVLNQDLWRLLDNLQAQVTAKVALQWRYVKGHSGDKGNDRCDEIARAFSLGRVPNLRQAKRLAQPQTKPQAQPQADPQADLKKAVVLENESVIETLQSSHELGSPALSLESAPNPDSAGLNSASPNSASSASFESASFESASLESAYQTSDLDNRSNMTDPILDIDVPREVKVAQLRNVVDTLHMADEIARQGYLITSSELADLMDVNASAVTSRGDNWVWRNWVISRVRREGNQILWQLERVD
jgi:ribonuclease HI